MLVEFLAKHAARSRRGKFLDYVRTGWNSYSFIFYIGGISAILGSLFGVAGWLSTFVTVYFFYAAGKFKKLTDLEKERIEKSKSEKHR